MPWIDEEQIAEARKVDLLSYLQVCEPGERHQTAPNEYRTVSHSSLVISNGQWFWNRGGFGGYSALDYLVRVRGMSLPDAARAVMEAQASGSFSSLSVEKRGKSPQSVRGKRKWSFSPPKPVRFPCRAVEYLQRRGISTEVINYALRKGIAYESRYYNPESRYHNTAVCVFAGMNKSGKVVFAALRGIDSDLKMDKAGSDKRFGFFFPAKNPKAHHLAVFESPIDALSHATLQQRSGWKWDGFRLSLGGTSDVALISFL